MTFFEISIRLRSKFQIIWAAGEFVISSTLDVLFYAALAKRGPKIGLPMLPRSITTPLDSDREKNEVRLIILKLPESKFSSFNMNLTQSCKEPN